MMMDRAYASGRFELHFDDGTQCGILNSVDGGHFKSEPVGEQVGGENLVTRYPGRQKFEDITIVCGTTMSKSFWKWIAEYIDNKPTRRSGSIVALDFDNRERSRRNFYEAIIAEVQFPALDLKSKTPKAITVKISPERMDFAKEGQRRVQPVKTSPEIGKQKKQTPQNFGFRLGRISNELTQRVTKIDAFSVKQNVINAPVGGLLYSPKAIGRLEYPTISVYTPEAYLEPWMKWWEEFVGKGEHIGKNEDHAEITYMNSAFTEELLRLDLYGVGITGITFDKLEGHAESIRQAKIDLYVEYMKFEQKS